MLRFTKTAALGAVILLGSGHAALAVEAAAASAVNVRTGPGTTFSIVDRLDPGEVVNIRECSSNNWCFVEHSGPDGWVSAAYLTAVPGFEEDDAPVEPEPGTDCSFGFVIGPGGPSISINCGEEPPPPPPPPPPVEEDEACFYTGANYGGTERCYGVGVRNSLPASINDAISSVRLFGEASARLCVNQNLGGFCRTINADTPALGAQINDRASSLEVFIGAPPPPPPPPPPPVEEDEACFYTGNNYGGTERCYGVGVRNSLPGAINDAISSVKLFGEASARLCVNQNLGGFCRTINADTPELGAQINNRASSLEVFIGAPPPPPPPPPVEEDEACFYTGNNYGGTERCYGVGVRNSLPAAINDAISSVKLFGEASARLCVNQNLGGVCRTINADTPALAAQINNRASSLEVFTSGLPPPPPPEEPFTHSTGSIALQQTFTANLDNGVIGGAGVDIWYEAVSAAEKYITPRNGALLALGNRSNRGYAGCSIEAYAGESIPLWDMPVGSYVCVRTNAGRVSQFRLNGYTGTTMNIGYTTWEN